MPSGAVGILRWHDSNVCKVYEVQKNVNINIGDRVITSGFSKIYPPKLPVGSVSGVYDERGSYQKVVNVNIQNKKNNSGKITILYKNLEQFELVSNLLKRN